MKAIIEKMQETGSELETMSTDEFLVKLENADGEIDYCYFHTKKDLIGRGATGEVYKAYIYNSETGKLDHNRFVAIKVSGIKSIDNNKNKDKNESLDEYKIASQHSTTYKIIKHKHDNVDYIFFPQEFLKGKPVQNDKREVHPEIKKLTPSQILTAIITLLDKYIEMHHYTLRSGVAAHFDIKGANLLLDLVWDPKNKSQLLELNIHIIDFGLSKQLASDDPKQKTKLNFIGNEYFPDEAKKENGGIKSDIWQLAAMIAIFFGYDEYTPAIYLSNFYREELTRLKEFGFDALTIGIVADFINRMRHKDYDARPETGEVLKFFTTLKQLHSLLMLPSAQQSAKSINTLKAELCLLAEGCWHQLDFQADDIVKQLQKFEYSFIKNLRGQTHLIPDATLKKVTELLVKSSKTTTAITTTTTPTAEAPKEEKIKSKEPEQDESEMKLEKCFYIVTMKPYAPTVDLNWKYVEFLLKNKPLTITGLPPLQIYEEFKIAQAPLKNRRNSQIVCFKYPDSGSAKKEHITKENMLAVYDAEHGFTKLAAEPPSLIPKTI